jgi:hypothetical protein
VIRDEHKETLEREQDEREARERAEAAAAEQASADTRRLASMERIAAQFLQSSERTLRDCVSKFCVVESAFGALQSQLDRFAEERTKIAQMLDALEAQLDVAEQQV